MFITISCHSKFCTAQSMTNQKPDTIMLAIKQVVAKYDKHHFRATIILMDMQFEIIHGNLVKMQISLNTFLVLNNMSAL
jgi:hypothetical protein